MSTCQGKTIERMSEVIASNGHMLLIIVFTDGTAESHMLLRRATKEQRAAAKIK